MNSSTPPSNVGIPASKYRPDIDGLRAIAVLPVLLFHANIPGFSGGFVGVDIFFVISGYLITSILVKEFATNSYNIVSFYERRLRRIFPALLTVLLFVLAVAPFFLLPSEFRNLGRDVMSALLFVANINFWRQSGYFAEDAASKPLLHTWSLGVEEQFYLFTPIILWLIFRYASKHRLLIVGLGLLLSLAACIVLTPIKQDASFYLLPTRAWELLAGAWLAVYTTSRHPRGGVAAASPGLLRNVLGLIGLALVLLAVFTYRENMSFPGYAAIAPVLGAALLIHAGQYSLSGRLLASRPLVQVGLMSYSLYLWHWPLIVFARDAGWLDSVVGRAGVVVLSLIAAQLTLRFIESPTRNRQKLPVRTLVLSTLSLSVLVTAVSITYAQLGGWPSRLPASVVAMDNARNDISPSRARCHADGGLPDPAKACVLGGNRADAHVAVWADSHGVELSQAIGEQGVPVYAITYSACAPAVGYKSRIARPLCSKHNQQVLDFLSKSSQITTVVLTTYFTADQQDEQIRLMKNSAAQLHQMGKRVILVGPTPVPDSRMDVPTWLARGGERYYTYSGLGAPQLRQEFQGIADVFAPADVFCKRDGCDLLLQGKPTIFDTHHPSMHAARIVAAGLLPMLPVPAAQASLPTRSP